MSLQQFSTAHQYRNAPAQQIIELTKARIDARAVGPRNLNDDDKMFGPANNGIILAISHRDPAIAGLIFIEVYEHALAYQEKNNCQIHKGSITFNIGIARIRSADFTSAIHFFELAQEETRLTTGKKTWNIFLNQELFDTNFWDTLDLAEEKYPLTLHNDLWGVPYSKDAGKKSWRKLSGPSKLLYIVSAARRIHLRHLVDSSHWQESNSIRIEYWNLIADLARLLETEVYRKADIATPKPWQLKSLLKQGFAATQRGDISTLIDGYMNARNVHNTATFNMYYPAIKADIENAGLTKIERIAHAAHLLYVTRNQVQHHVDRRLILYKNIEEAKFTSDVLLSLCRLSAWAKKA
ncbi:hypothetical protein VN12_21275 [Pirellula sp. SH-Sr6A]|uniref:hypothetical protein n=1 Tax=Pirellula sp. SH-Sr6A TaxID=1632865 RepID=UPI00078CBC4F|nr:hypothetical protein [Pirellula sp. SH-Sr6A]AMV34671.1 hypothetical protein VN12_21275 [Pirellula sp. SH-Sr6A]